MRTPWVEYFLNIAQEVSKRSTCDRLHVGCVITRQNRILVTGYNGSSPGRPHCDDVGHLMVDGHCKRTVHAEVNAVAQAAKHGVSIQGATAYVTHKPCADCAAVLTNAGVVFQIHDEDYG